jgi:hypothetical protein
VTVQPPPPAMTQAPSRLRRITEPTWAETCSVVSRARKSERSAAHRYRCHRRCLPLPRPRPHGSHRRRWSLAGAEAVLRLRALWTNGDFDDYWAFHLEREHERTHRSRYADGRVPYPLAPSRTMLRAIK